MIFEWECGACGTSADHFEHSAADRGCETYLCRCGSTMAPVVSMGAPLLWAEEGRARTLYNLGPEPVTVRSPKEYRAAMKRAGVTHAGQRIGEKGCWT